MKRQDTLFLRQRKEVIILPNSYTTDVLSHSQLEFLAKRLPQTKCSIGRPAYTNQELLPGILKVLRSGSRWRDLDNKDYPSGVTHWRRLRYWQRQNGFEDLWVFILELLLKEKKLVLKTSSIDGTLISSFAFKDTTSYSGKHHRTGTKVSLIVDSLGIPISKLIDIGSAHDSPLAIPTIQQIPTRLLELIELMLADKGYDDAKIRSYLESIDIASDIPQRDLPITWRQKLLLKNIQDLKSRGEKSNHQRFVVERTNAWTKSFRRLRFRFDYSLLSFTAFLNLAFVVICVRKLLP